MKKLLEIHEKIEFEKDLPQNDLLRFVSRIQLSMRTQGEKEKRHSLKENNPYFKEALRRFNKSESLKSQIEPDFLEAVDFGLRFLSGEDIESNMTAGFRLDNFECIRDTNGGTVGDKAAYMTRFEYSLNSGRWVFILFDNPDSGKMDILLQRKARQSVDSESLSLTSDSNPDLGFNVF